jgi:hypothetical protein
MSVLIAGARTLPPGPLVWRVANLPDPAQAEAGAGPRGLVAQAAGRVWLFTLATAGAPPSPGTQVAEIGPLQRVQASRYLLRVNEARGAPGSITAPHTHPGSEVFYVLTGETT